MVVPVPVVYLKAAAERQMVDLEPAELLRLLNIYRSNKMKTALVDVNGFVQNVIALQDGADYTPPEGLQIQEVNDWVDIGQSVDVAAPQPREQTEAERKEIRREAYVGDLALVAVFDIEKRIIPALAFDDFLDSLEQKAVELRRDTRPGAPIDINP